MTELEKQQRKLEAELAHVQDELRREKLHTQKQEAITVAEMCKALSQLPPDTKIFFCREHEQPIEPIKHGGQLPIFYSPHLEIAFWAIGAWPRWGQWGLNAQSLDFYFGVAQEGE